MRDILNRRQFPWGRSSTRCGPGNALKNLFAARKKSVLVFTKSSGFEHDCSEESRRQAQHSGNRRSRRLGARHGFDVTATKDGGVFDSNDFRKHAAVPLLHHRRSHYARKRCKPSNVAPRGKQSSTRCRRRRPSDLLASTPLATPSILRPTRRTIRTATSLMANSLIPIWRMLGGEFITHGSTPRLQTGQCDRQRPEVPRARRSYFSRQLQRRVVFAEGLPNRSTRDSHLGHQGHDGRAVPACAVSNDLGREWRTRAVCSTTAIGDRPGETGRIRSS